ncbi:hypothetical protein NELON_11050 [Neisseria elongata subsp. glycolytica ATCC 29315]|uniref:Uncharacterized protein n=1 Tax=Neisseria elongata subsp. glycolytica ATCC 29315 TaxID=546263 RepID=D4DSZ6_NEIEG|nr:hypothetical protein [Neisseria elongata]AJE19390.1 hypothetical protein NELON_11050 [Neisseria elongata subsp. glycolytica ATCC 29315]EFE48998.1 hypothetical protein NEIELOOT_02193 [Neisseria elongata subsp. glycolytica ATCC 29315]SQH49163.1 Uncharacterised protein [Neisseria elongata subsp. glycolytica]
MNTTQDALTRNRQKGQPVQWKKSLNEIEEMVCRQTERHIRIEDKVGLDLVLEHVYDDGLLFGYRLPFGLNAIAKTAGKILAGRVRTKKLNWDAEKQQIRVNLSVFGQITPLFANHKLVSAEIDNNQLCLNFSPKETNP